MKKFSKVFKTEKTFYLMTLVAFSITTFNINTTCMFAIHQPKLPEQAKKLRKF